MTKEFRFWIGLLGISLVLASTSVRASSAWPKEVPMKGSGAGQITSVTPGPSGVAISGEGSGEATHLGRFTRTESILLDPATGTFTGSIIFTAADGSELYCNLSGAFTGPGTAAGTYTLTGGTGRFIGVSGTAEFAVSQSDPINYTFEFLGTIDLS